MSTGKNCGDQFTDGITQGYQWYPLYGGMQDFNYVSRETFEITLELSCVKYPQASELQGYWQDNKVSLLEYAKATLHGVSGLFLFVLQKRSRDIFIIINTLLYFP
jgi:carboxypeptidase D